MLKRIKTAIEFIKAYIKNNDQEYQKIMIMCDIGMTEQLKNEFVKSFNGIKVYKKQHIYYCCFDLNNGWEVNVFTSNVDPLTFMGPYWSLIVLFDINMNNFNSLLSRRKDAFVWL